MKNLGENTLYNYEKLLNTSQEELDNKNLMDKYLVDLAKLKDKAFVSTVILWLRLWKWKQWEKNIYYDVTRIFSRNEIKRKKIK